MLSISEKRENKMELLFETVTVKPIDWHVAVVKIYSRRGS